MILNFTFQIVGLRIDWPVGCVVGWAVGCPVGWLVGWPVGWPVGLTADTKMRCRCSSM